MTTAIDPTRVISSNMLLSDFVGCNSVYYNGYPNPVQTDVWFRGSRVIQNWERLAHYISNAKDVVAGRADPAHSCGTHSFSISYGWIHPRLSEKIVKWKPGHQPSYHRWDMGAACDINFHSLTYAPYHFGLVMDAEMHNIFSPLGIAVVLNAPEAVRGQLDRTITYSESPYICLAVPNSSNEGLQKWYENRFTGERGVKPQFITYRGGRGGPGTSRLRPLEGDWRGGGWPSHHGGGKRQYHHIRTSLYTVMSDWLYDRDRVHFGTANRMPMSTTRYETLKYAMHCAGAVFDVMQSYIPGHLSILEGLKMGKRSSNWEENLEWSFTVTHPPGHGAILYEQMGDTILGEYGERLSITYSDALPTRTYIGPEGGEARSGRQHRLQVRGTFDGQQHYDFDTASRSPAFREEGRERSNGGGSGPEGVDETPRRTRRRRSQGGSRGSVRTRTFRGGD